MRKLLPDICRIQYGYAFDSVKFSDSEGIPLIRIRDVVRGYSETYTTEECGEEYIVNDGDMLIGMDGEFNIAHWKGGKAYLNQRVCRLIPNGEVDALYLYYFMPKALKVIEDKTPFVTVKHLSAKELNKVVVPLPLMEEQRKIANSLKKVDELIALRKEQLGKLDQLVKSRFIELFGSPIANEYGWPIATLGELCLKITDGEHQNPQFVDNGIPMVMANNVQDKGVVFDGCRYISTENYEKFSRKCCPEFGDVLLVSRGATIGRCCINSESIPFSLMGSVILIKNNKERISSAYLVNWLKNEEIKPMIYTTSSASAQQAIYMKDLVVRKVAVPPMELQEQYAAFVKQTDKSKLAIQQSLDKLELLKKSLMQEYFG